MGGFGERKGKKEMIYLHYNPDNEANKTVNNK